MLYIDIMLRNFLFALPLFFFLLVFFHILKKIELKKRQKKLDRMSYEFSKKMYQREQEFLKNINGVSVPIVYFQRNLSTEMIRKFYKNLVELQRETVKVRQISLNEDFSISAYDFKMHHKQVKKDIPTLNFSISDKIEIEKMEFKLKRSGGNNLCYN